MNRFDQGVREYERLLHELAFVEPGAGSFIPRLGAAASAAERYLILQELRYACNSKAFRDTGDDRVHERCEAILAHTRIFDRLALFDLYPESAAQRQEWLRAIRATGATHPQWSFRDEGCIRFGLAFCHLHEDGRLTPGRIWNHLCGYAGDASDLALRVVPAQIEAVRRALGHAFDDEAARRDAAPE